MNQTIQKIHRQEKILLSLDKLNFSTRKQLQIINKLGGDRNAHRILHEMEKDKLISSVRKEYKVYYVSNKGKQRVGSNKGELKRDKINHTLMLNDLYIKLGMPADWIKEFPVKMNGELFLVSDAAFTKNGIKHFVEIDNQQTMINNTDKVKKYKELFSIMFKEYRYHPVLIWYTLSDVRKKKLKELCDKQGIKNIIY